MNKTKGPLRDVERVETWKSRSIRGCYGHHEFYMTRLWLSCGHQITRKESQGIPKRARCKHPACIREAKRS